MLEQLVPQDHLLRKIDKYIDFSFIRDLTRDLYCHTNGRPAVDLVVLFKMLFIGYLYGIRSERQLVKDIEVNLAYRWFLGYSITEKIPDSSTISQNRIRRFKGTDIPKKIFYNIVLQAIEKGLVGGKILYSDSTHIKANANKRKFEKVEVDVTPKEYIEQLDIDVNADREIISVVAYRRSPHKKGMYTKNKYIYDYDKDIYICPNNVALIYKTTTREGYKEYRCFEEICMCCPHKDKCLGERSKYKIIRRHVWENHKDDNKNFLKTEKGKAIYDRRKETVERSFADSKNLHGLRYARFRGHEKVSEQRLLTAAVQNMKKIATRLSLLFSYYISNFNDIMYFKLYPPLVNKNPLFFKQGVFQQTEN